jgi:hypothetical protein
MKVLKTSIGIKLSLYGFTFTTRESSSHVQPRYPPKQAHELSLKAPLLVVAQTPDSPQMSCIGRYLKYSFRKKNFIGLTD